MKEICKNCASCQPTYKGYMCMKSAKGKKTRAQGTCEDFRPKR